MNMIQIVRLKDMLNDSKYADKHKLIEKQLAYLNTWVK